MPSTVTGAGSPRTDSAWATKAACAVGQDTPAPSATSTTERAASPTHRPIWVRSRVVVRRRAGTCGIASVKLTRLQVWLRHRYRVLFHRRVIGSSPYRTSRGFVTVRSFTESDAIPQSGQREAFGSTVITSTTRVRSARLTTALTASPSSPNNNDVGSTMPLVLLRILFASQHPDSRKPGAPHVNDTPEP